MKWSRHRHVSHWLILVDFTESSFFVVPLDVMWAPMSLAYLNWIWHYATTLTIAASVFGGRLGYSVRVLAFGLAEPLHQLGCWESYLESHPWFEQWGRWAVLVAAFTPIPYKVRCGGHACLLPLP
jgi:membrane protein YqaA with SNARE-associated domain